MKKDRFTQLLADSIESDAPQPTLDEVVRFRPRRRKARRSPLIIGVGVIAASAAIFFLPDSPGEPEIAALTYSTDWLAEPPGFEWISNVPELGINLGENHADL